MSDLSIINQYKRISPDFTEKELKELELRSSIVSMSFELMNDRDWYNSSVGRWGSKDGLRINGHCTTSEGYSVFEKSSSKKGLVHLKEPAMYHICWSQQIFTNEKQDLIFKLMTRNQEITQFKTVYPGWSSICINNTMFIGSIGSPVSELEIRINNSNPIYLAGHNTLELIKY